MSYKYELHADFSKQGIDQPSFLTYSFFILEVLRMLSSPSLYLSSSSPPLSPSLPLFPLFPLFPTQRSSRNLIYRKGRGNVFLLISLQLLIRRDNMTQRNTILVVSDVHLASKHFWDETQKNYFWKFLQQLAEDPFTLELVLNGDIIETWASPIEVPSSPLFPSFPFLPDRCDVEELLWITSRNSR